MAIFLLWFSIFSFTVFTVALVICVFRFLRSRQLTQGLYLLLVLVFDLWLLTFTYLFFTDVYLRPLSSGARMALGLARMLVSAVILFLYGDLVLRLAGRAPAAARRWLLLIAPGTYCAVILLSLRSISLPVAGIITFLYFSYLAAVGVYSNIAGNRNRVELANTVRRYLRPD